MYLTQQTLAEKKTEKDSAETKRLRVRERNADWFEDRTDKMLAEEENIQEMLAEEENIQETLAGNVTFRRDFL